MPNAALTGAHAPTRVRVKRLVKALGILRERFYGQLSPLNKYRNCPLTFELNLKGSQHRIYINPLDLKFLANIGNFDLERI